MKQKITFKTIAAGLALAISGGLYAQSTDWLDGMRDPSVNFYQVKEQFKQSWGNRDSTEKGKGWKQFKRWEAFMEERTFPTGVRPDPAILWQEMMRAKTEAPESNYPNMGDWQPMGPANGNAIDGIGRINGITFDPTNTNIVWAGSPSGGLWKSTDKGLSWSTNTDLLPNLGVSVIVINPQNNQEMYITTGDRDVTDTYSYGIMKSTDGGQTWGPTGLSYNISQFRSITGLIIDANHPDTLTTTTSVGIYTTYDGGVNWTLRQSGNFSCIVHKPGDYNTMYAASRGGNVRIFKSVNGGVNWTMLSNGLPTTGLRRAEIAVTPDDPNYVYVLFGRSSDNGFHSVCRSTDDGLTFSTMATTPNLMGWNTSGNDSGGQVWYDLCIAVSPTNKNEVYTGGVNIWKSTNGGSTWSINAHWTGAGGTPYVHADHHCFTWEPGTSNLWNGNDGGVSRTNNGGNSWADRNDGLQITQYYRIGLSETNANTFLGGTQDNGTHRHNAGVWARVRGGDGMECAIDHQNGNIMYASVYYGNFRKSTNGGNNFNASFNLTPSGTGNWVTPFVIDPSNSEILYAGFTSLWKSTNRGVSFTATSGPINGSTNLNAIAVAPSDGNVIYVASTNSVFRSTNGGASWTNISSGLGGGTSTYIAISDFDPNRIWVTKSGYTGNSKVFFSSNGGNSWTNLSAGLPNLPVNCVVFENGSPDGIYIGTDVGVYYRDNTTNGWVQFMNNLPNVIVNELEIHYDSRKLRAGTYGRGVWESPLFSDLKRAPEADFISSAFATCNIGDTITLTSTSTFAPETYLWTITPNTFTFVNGTNDTMPVIQVVMQSTGIYSVRLDVANTFGSDSKTDPRAISVGGATLPFFEGFEDTDPLSRWAINNPDAGITWALQPVVGNGSATAVYLNHYNYVTVGAVDELVSPAISVANHDSVRMTFDYAYRTYTTPNRSDSLKVFLSNDCGATWSLVASFAENGNNNFATGNPLGANFIPSGGGDWCGSGNGPACGNLLLSPFITSNTILVKFQAINDYGNNLFLDNINLFGTPNAAPVANFFANANICEGGAVTFTNLSQNSPTNYSWSFPGGTPATSTAAAPVVVYNSFGVYPVTLIAQNAVGQDTLELLNYVDVTTSVLPTIAITPTQTAICPGEPVVFNAIVTNEGANPVYTWTLNGNPIGGNGSSATIVINSATDVVRCELLSDATCANPASVASSNVSVTVYQVPTPTWSAPAGFCSDQAPVMLTGATPAGGTFSGPGVINNQFSPAFAGVGNHRIVYTYTTATGCEVSVDAIIAVETPPTVFLTTEAICVTEAPFAPNFGFPFGGTYEVNGQPVTTIDPAQYTPGTKVEIAYRLSQGLCEVLKKDSLTFVQAPPKATILVEWGKLTCLETGYNYQWLDANGNNIPGATNQIFFPPALGLYSVRLSANANCAETSEPAYLWSVGLDEATGSAAIQLYPNPNNGLFNLEVPALSKEVTQIRVLNATGQVVYEAANNWAPGTTVLGLDLKGLAQGVYTLQLEHGQQRYIKRFTIL